MKHTMLTGLSTAGLLLSATLPSFADEDPITIVITESRSAETVDSTLAPVSIITREDIEQTGATSVTDVLKTVPGISLTNTGGLGKVASVFLRGTESDHVLVLIDGIKVGSATLGTTPFQNLPIDQIERIEVVRGPRSSLYGSEAIGGVIQFFTRKGSGEMRPELSIGVGSHALAKVDAGISGGTEKGWYRLGVSSLSTDGINDCRGSSVEFAGCFTEEPDDDAYDNQSISLRGGTQVNDRVALEGNLLVSDNEAEFDGSFQNESETATKLVSLKSSFKVNENWNSTLLLAKSEDQSDNFLNGAFSSTFDTERTQINFQNDIVVGENSLLIAGIDYQDDEVNSTESFTVSSRDNTGAFVLFQTQMNANSFEASIRNDDNEQFGSETTGGLSWGHQLDGGIKLTASYGTAFKAPTFNELYFPGFGNANLVPETSESIDLGFSKSTSNGTWAVNIYQTEVENLIGFDSVTFLPVNVDMAKLSGVEFSGSTQISGWNVSANLTMQKPENDSGGLNQGNTLPRRAERIISLNFDRSFGRYSIGGSIFNQDESYDDLGNFRELDGFTLVDLHGSFQVNHNWTLGLSVKNLFDEEYETAAFFNQDGRNFLATLRYTPKSN